MAWHAEPSEIGCGQPLRSHFCYSPCATQALAKMSSLLPGHILSFLPLCFVHAVFSICNTFHPNPTWMSQPNTTSSVKLLRVSSPAFPSLYDH